ncbi:hypothetical protein OSB04_000640 [Centaurea solstitialis]|uniref:Uncharacterized protein n=1 Tax=Centaurea solstitialis TaxID=347529 RepID=A0AA38TPP7_9ASTR|nr:hypothetical protein OSB04_000640 [Centaurea solstitialis]
MDVKDLTLAHVKSHLQLFSFNFFTIFDMYRTVKTTDKPAASSGQSDGSGEDDISTMGSGGLRRFTDQRGSADLQESDYPNYSAAANTTLWSNSSSNREGWLPTNGDMNDLRPSSTSLPQRNASQQVEECDPSRSKSCLGSNMDQKNPCLEFTLGRPDWLQKNATDLSLSIFSSSFFAFRICALVCPYNGQQKPEFYATEVLKRKNKMMKKTKKKV